MDQKNLTVLVTALDGVGHMNACIGLAEQLRDRGHKIVFVAHDSWKGKLSALGFIEEFYNPVKINETSNENELSFLPALATKMAPGFQAEPEDQVEGLYVKFWTEFYSQAKEYDPVFRKIVNKHKPDIIVCDLMVQQPALMNAGIPWVYSISLSPLGISKKNVPPAMLGLPVTCGDCPIWKRCTEAYRLGMRELTDNYKKWLLNNGGPELKYDQLPFVVNYSPYANIYMYPKELDYTDLRPNPPNFYRFDTFIRSSNTGFVIPEVLQNKPGKLIYFSMGTIGASELGVMRRLISILAKSPNRFIVSKGPLADKLELSENMWGEATVPQVEVIPLVDLVITHGGNNTLTESCYYGKPCLVLPLFADQGDNGQRIMEKGLGLRLQPYSATEDEILSAIEYLLGNEEIRLKLSQISKRIQGSNSQARAAELIEKVGFGQIPTKP